MKNGSFPEAPPATKKPHVAHVVESFGAGCLTSIATLCRMMRDDFSFTVIHSLRPETPENFRALFPPEVEFQYLPEMENRIHPVKNFRAYRSLKSALKKLAPDVVHCHSSIAGFLGRMAAFSGGWPVLYSPRGYSFLRDHIGPLNRAVCTAMEWLAARGNSITVACGEEEYGCAARLAPQEKCFFIPNALDLSAIDACAGAPAEKAPGEPLLAGTCGRLSLQRNFVYFSKVAGLVDEVRWIWLGASKDTDLLPESVARTGWLTREQALAGMAKLDIYVHSSAWDGLSNTLLEAMALGRPVVATDIPANRAVVEDGVTGFLCQDEAHMAETVKKLLADAELRSRVGRAARAYIEEKHDAAKVYQNFGALYRRLAGAGHAA
ncbi:MAG: glycosyltransferase family 4 protein [Desulfovibrio sp.]|uniref:glycosyltransferase n=1 Tax=Desulfovibrio sp. TaxID=885 RepID=UPI001A6886B8|nr:glycosyltransferase [Desulfovibrio sp.]MBD5416909.1 glycosyltransferase family 4 protein [Desulfovibrio sp.]